MVNLLLAAGLGSGAALIILLTLTLFDGRLRVWPTQGKGTWQSVAFWSLFRALNVASIGLALADRGSLGITPTPLRGAGLVLAAVCLALYLRSLASLGPTNTYCRRAGLVERGIYRWTRNPQYTTIIPAYFALAVAADSIWAWGVISMLATAYVLMAYAEEPWLRIAYPDVYDRYARRVPRFYNWRRTRAFFRLGRRQLPPHPRRNSAPALRHLSATNSTGKRR